MDWRRRKRQIVLFLVAILLPAVVLVGLAVRLFREDVELANKRLVEEHRGAIEQVHRELAARLETIKLQEVDRRIRNTDAITIPSSKSPVVLVAAVSGERLILPWENEVKAAKPNSRTASLLHDGETLEFSRSDLTGAAELYRQGRTAATDLSEDCESRLDLGRVQLRVRRKDEALSTYLGMLKQCGDAADEDGIAYRLYAAEQLLKNGLDATGASTYLVGEAKRSIWRPPLPLYLMQNLLQAASGDDIDKVRERIKQTVHDAVQIDDLAREFSHVQARMDPPLTSSGDSRWVSFTLPSDDPWLVTTVPSPPLAIVVSARKIAPPGVRLIAMQTASSEAVGEGFPSLRVEWQNGTGAPVSEPAPVMLYTAGIALILGVTLLGGYLLLRDVNREVQMAEMRSHFVASVSHELKTPLTAIRMFAETLILGRSDDPATTFEYLQTIMNESDRLTQLVDNVLDFSKIERGSKTYRMRPTALSDVARSAARAMHYQFEQQGFALNLSIEDPSPTVSADPDAMEQAILNLLTNAMKYSGDSRRIEMQVRCDSSREAAIEVTDWGLGIAAEEHGKIFEKFYRVPSPEHQQIAGTGLGLTVVAHIVQAHGGNIDVRSSPGHGSTFSIRIPLQTTEAHA